MRHLLTPDDLILEEIKTLIDIAYDIEANKNKYSKLCDGKTMATLFYEASTRTRLSHEAAMINLGGSILGFSSADSSSTSKGESVSDTIRTVSCYADIAVMRHPTPYTPMDAAIHSSIPVINAGDGGNQHPTQTLTDLLTIHREKGRLENLTIGLCGDLKHGRTVHSLVQALARYDGIQFVFIAPDELQIPAYILEDVLNHNGIGYTLSRELEDNLDNLDIIYMTRIQKERFVDNDEYERLKDSYILDAEKMKSASDSTLIMHPLPRVNEISTDLDNDPRAIYFKQVQYGVYIRMALILMLLGIDGI